MPLYDVRCATHGILEVFRSMADPAPWVCPTEGCGQSAPQHFSPRRAPGVRVEDYENIGAERGGDCPGEFLGLPEIRTSIGTDSKGRERFALRPATIADIPNRKAFLEAAKKAGLSPGDEGRYRTVGQR